MSAPKFVTAGLCAVVTLLVSPMVAFAQADSNASRPWASDQAAADADAANGQCQDAVALYQRAVATAEAGQQDAATKAAIAKMLVGEGNCFLKLQRPEDAQAAYEKAAPLSPNPGTAYFNLCATDYNAGKTAAALVACDKALAFDPGKADAYFIKGSVLFGEGQFANGKYNLPPGTLEALRKYLALAPDGPHAGDVKQMLDASK